MHDYRRILALVDFDALGERVARRAASLARSSQADLGLLHWIQPDTGFDGGYPPPSLAEQHQGYEQAALRRLGSMAGKLESVDPELLAVFGHGRSTLIDRVAAWSPDLVVVGRDPGGLDQHHDLLTLGQAQGASGRLIRAMAGLLPGAMGRLAW